MENREIINNKQIMENKAEKKKESILQKELNLKEILLVIGVFGLIAVYFGVFIYPRYSEYKNSVNQLEQVQQQIITYESKITTLPNLKNELSRLNSEIEVEKRKLSHNMEDGMFLVGLSNLINSLDIDLVSYTMDETTSYKSFYAIPTTIELRGNYNYIRKVMKYLEEQKNSTQILDYRMETYIEENKAVTTEEKQVESTTNIVSDSEVFWTNSGSKYHKNDCSELVAESNNSGEIVSNGDVTTSGKSSPCEVCKPYTLNSTETENEDEVVEKSEPKATGDIVARFKFIMYSTENPKYGLGIENSDNWKPGKYNPFIVTTR